MTHALDICARLSLMATIAVTLVVLSGIVNAGFCVEGSFLNLLAS
jgi:putative copper export protein